MVKASRGGALHQGLSLAYLVRMSETPVLMVSKLAEISPRALPLGAARLASMLGASARVELANQDESARSFATRLAAMGPRILGFSVYLWSRDYLAETSRYLDEDHSQILRVAGGPEASADPQSLLEQGKFHLVLAGEGESVIKDIVGEFEQHGLNLAAWKEIPGLHARGRPTPRIARSPGADLGSIPSPYLTRHLNPRPYGGALWEISRGCPFSCTYCYESRGEKITRSLDMESTEKELRFLAENGAYRIFVLDPTFNMHKKRSLAILSLIETCAPDIHFDFEVRAELLDRDLAQAFGRIQTALQIGLQSAHGEVLKRVGRDINQKLYKGKLALLDQAGVVFGLDLMLGLPGDSLGGFLESLDFALSCRPNHLDIFRLAILPGTTLALDAKGEGLIWDENSPYLVRSGPGFPAQDLDRAEALAGLCQVFYNKGRSVTWFEPVMRVLGWKPSAFFSWALDEVQKPAPGMAVPQKAAEGTPEISAWQAELLQAACKASGQGHAAEACKSMALYFGAWYRAMAEGSRTVLDLAYTPDSLEGPALEDFPRWVRQARKSKGRYRIGPDARHGVQVRRQGS